MFPYSPSSNPALRSHVNSQLAWFNDLNKTLSGSFQAVCEANLKLGQSMIEESMSASKRMLSSERPFDAMGAAAAHAQPASDKLRAYQQHLSLLAAEVHVELARVTQEHSSETARTAQALAEEVTRAASEDSARGVRQQEEVSKTYRDPFQKADAQAGNGSGASMQFDGLADNGSVQGHVQGPTAQPAPQTGNKPQRKPG